MIIMIQRQGGDGREDWLFDGWFLRPTGDRRNSLVYDGVHLIDYDPLATRRWAFDGREVRLVGDPAPLWIVDSAFLSRPGTAAPAWRFDGLELTQAQGDRPDSWRASAEIPLLVACFSASLL